MVCFRQHNRKPPPQQKKQKKEKENLNKEFFYYKIIGLQWNRRKKNKYKFFWYFSSFSKVFYCMTHTHTHNYDTDMCVCVCLFIEIDWEIVHLFLLLNGHLLLLANLTRTSTLYFILLKRFFVFIFVITKKKALSSP
jgi:hypothetical protein